MKCPWYCDGKQCPGELIFISFYRSDMGIWNGIDKNDYLEQWKCNKCGRIFTRSYKWSFLKK